MEFKYIHEFPKYQINENGTILKMENNEFEAKGNEILEIIDSYYEGDPLLLTGKYEIADLVASTFLKYPIGFGELKHINNNKNDNHYENLQWKIIDKNYDDEGFLIENKIEIKELPRYPLHSITSDGHIINRKSKKTMKENYTQKDGKGRVRLPLHKVKRKERSKDETVLIEDLMVSMFLKKPKKNCILKRKNGLEMDNRIENFYWEIGEDGNLEFIKDYSKNFKIFNTQQKEKINNESNKEEIDIFHPENGKDEYFKEIEKEIFNEDYDEDYDEENETILKYKTENYHLPIYEKFQTEDIKYDVSNCVKMDGKMWSIAKYKGKILKNFMISEDFDLFSKKLNKIITDDNSQMLITRKSGGFSRKYNFTIDKSRVYIDLKDIASSTFLNPPENYVTTVYRNWNKNNKNGKYFDQKNHYTNIIWLTEDDFSFVGDPKEKLKISKNGDLYSLRNDKYVLLKEIEVEEGELRKVKVNLSENRVKIYNLHILTALAFVERPDISYKYVVHKDGDVSNNNYKNLIWLNTLNGIHNDGIKYYEIPGCPEYVLSETNIPYSFKRGILKQMKIKKDIKGYMRLSLTTIKGRKNLLYHRIVSATRNSDHDENLYVDHIDRNKQNYNHENLRCVTPKENSQNVVYSKKGKEVAQIDKNGKIIEIFENSKKASIILGKEYNYAGIRECARKNSLSDANNFKYKNFIWKYTDKKQKYVCKNGEYFKIMFGNFQGLDLEYDNYTISNYGTIINCNTGYSKSYFYDGYPSVKLSKNGDSKSFLVHVLVGHIFVSGKTDERRYVNHKDEDITNFHSENLSWMTSSENNSYSSYRFGKPVKKIDMTTKELIDVYNSREEAARSCGKERKGWCIGKACEGKFSHAFGFLWEDIKDEELSKYEKLEINVRKNFPRES